jgi:two-component system OmpR family sensor kinase
MMGRSLVSRLIWLLASAMALLWLLGSVTAGMLTVFEVNERLDNALVEVAQRLLPATADALSAPQVMDDRARQLVATLNPRALAYQIMAPNGWVALRSENAPAAPFTTAFKRGFSDIPRWRVYIQPAEAGGYFIEVAEPQIHRSEALRRAVGLSVLPLLLFLPIAWLMIRWVVKRSMRSLIRLRQEIGQRDGSNLNCIPELPMPSELVPIHTAVNRLLDRLQRALVNERRFAASSAHELRTPIAAVQAQLQVLAAQLAATAHAERALHIVGQVKALGNLVEKLLQFSRADAGLVLKRERIDVTQLLAILMDDFDRQEGVGQRLVLDRRRQGPFMVLADLDVLGIAVRNLLENAVRYGAADAPIEVNLDDEQYSLRVRSGGAVVPPDVLATLKLPFRRGPTQGAGGGLGLAIVETIMVQLGGRLELASPAAGRADGFEALLFFPAPAAQRGTGATGAVGEAVPADAG